MSRAEETIAESNKLGSGPITAENSAETIRAIRHFVINARIGLDECWRLAEEANKLSHKALDRLDDLTGVPGQTHIDQGGTIGRIETQIRALGQQLESSTKAVTRWVKWGIATIVGLSGVAATIYAARGH